MSSQWEHLSAIPDDALMEGSPEDFAARLRQRAHAFGSVLYDPQRWRLEPLPDEVYTQRLIFYLRRRSWAEWYFGTVTVARQIVALDASERSLTLRLARQIQDEVRHHDAFAASSRKRGGEWRVETFPAPQNLNEMRGAQEAARSPGQMAAANQLAGEVVLLIHGQAEGNVLRQLVPQDVQATMEDVETDEPAHVELGMALVAREATAPAARREMARAQEEFLSALGKQHAWELSTLGGSYIGDVPGFRS